MELRDRASANLSFELAARLQAEIEAVAWILAEQKVTHLVPAGDADAYGWNDGLLVTFRVRGGRLCAWEQRACGRPAAQPWLEKTPPVWLGFATRAAELSSRLTAAR